MTDPVSVVVGEPQTDPRKPGNQTSEHFWTKVLVICGLILSVAGFAGDFISEVSGLLPGGSTALRYAGIAGVIVAGVSKGAYLVSRTLVKMKLVDAEIAAKEIVGDPAATVLGDDAPGGSKS